jgi:CBS domain-containing protein
MSLLVKDVMTKNVITVDSSAPVKKVAELMDKHDIGCLIVMKEGKPIGIITERDMLKRVLLQFRDPRMTRVNDIMSTPLIASNPETNVREAVRLMNERRIKKLPVVEASHLIGLLTITDLVRSLAYFEHVITSLCSRCKWGKNSSITPG